jgi:tetratricopeptide (TPR) repeat protein
MAIAVALIVTNTAAGAAETTAASGVPDNDVATQSQRSEYGIALAMSGESLEAESVFASLLSSTPGDARALTNLGNLRVMKGEFGVALAFYDKALRAVPDEAGVVLDRAIALLLIGDTERAEAEAARAVTLAGGESQADWLLGLSSAEPGPTSRASEKQFLSKDQIRALLQAAARRVPRSPAPSLAAHDSVSSEARARRPNSTWRSAGTRASDGGDVATMLYWMK